MQVLSVWKCRMRVANEATWNINNLRMEGIMSTNALDFVGDAAKAFIEMPAALFIDGRWSHDAAAHVLPIIDPASGQEIGQIQEADGDAVAAAVVAARRAFEGTWRRIGPAARERLLHSLADEIERDAETLADLLTADMGAPRTAARNFEVVKTIEVFRYFAGFPTKIGGRTIDIGPEMGGGEFFTYTTAEPVGVVGAIIPWNAPLMITAWKLAPALAAGCTVVVKPSEDASLAVLRLAELVRRAGFPDGVLNVLSGRGETTGEALLRNPGIDKFAFTGSTAVGRRVHEYAVERSVRVGLELGGKSPVIVLPGTNLESAVSGIAMGAFANAGQICVSGSRVFVHRSLEDELQQRLASFASSLKLGHGFDPQTQIGPIVSSRQLARVQSYAATGAKQGRVLAGGSSPRREGFFFEPTVIGDLPTDSPLLHEEIFGPVITLESYEDAEEVVARTNAMSHGLAAYVWGRDHDRIQSLAARLRVGTVFVNTPGFPPAAVPTGGFRESGVGRDLGAEGLAGYLETKAVIARIG
ncbi:aldehyde dehydrogenase family protein [Trinickia terrae]|nr:aldehyde dehydrogenase family protein [Trinickia terrae]